MQLAKIEYLKNQDELFSHPYYWAGFVVQGDPTALQLKKTEPQHIWMIVFIPVMLMSLIYLLVWRKKETQ